MGIKDEIQLPPEILKIPMANNDYGTSNKSSVSV